MKKKTFEALLYSTVGIAGMFVLLLAVYIVSSEAKIRVDVTANKAHTLSTGTKQILNKLDSRITVRFYCTQGDNAMPPALRTYAKKVEDLLAEYDQEAKGKLLVEKFDPKPDSDVEDAARLNGIQGRATGPFGSDKIYLGLSVSLLDEKFTLPWLAPERERLLEYDISRAIAAVVNRSRPVVGIMTGLPVFGDAPTITQHPGDNHEEEWAFVSELKKDYDLRQVPLSASTIDERIKVLIVAHPLQISNKAEYAIDQFLLRGGKLLAFIDPHAYFDQHHDRSDNFTMVGDNAAASNLDKLLKAWGLSMDPEKVVADTSFASRNTQTGESMPTLLLVTRDGISQTEPVTSQLDNLVLPFAGVISGQPADGLKETVLIKSSKNSMLVDSLVCTMASDKIMRDFKPSNVEYPLVVHLTGNFRTAFPAGLPAEAAAEGYSTAPEIKESHGKGEVILVADTDLLNDKMSVRVQYAMGHKVVQSVNGNLNFVQSMVEQFAGDEDLMTSRSRASLSHPFTRVKQMEAKAGKEWEEKVRLLETRQRDMEKKIKTLQTTRGPGEQGAIVSPEQEIELQNSQAELAKVTKDLKTVRKNLRKDTDALEFRAKVINIGAMPAIVALSGIGMAVIRIRRKPSK
jgi:ABC-type uncharacterized transport system involved in gliding motility auxiliary subunit